MATGIFTSVSFMWSLQRRERHRHAACTEKVENKVQPVTELCFPSSAVDRDASTLTSEMSLMGCDRCRNFLLMLSQRVSRCCLHLRCGLPPVTEGMVTSEASAADVRQASTCGRAIRSLWVSMFSVA